MQLQIVLDGKLLWTGAGSCLISVPKKLVLFGGCSNADAIDVKMDGLFLTRNHLLKCWG